MTNNYRSMVVRAARAGEEYLRKDGGEEVAAEAQSHTRVQGRPPTRIRDHDGMKQSRWIPADPTIKSAAYELESVVGQRWGRDGATTTSEKSHSTTALAWNGCRHRRLTGGDWGRLGDWSMNSMQ